MQKPSTQGVGGAAVHVVPAIKLPARVRVIADSGANTHAAQYLAAELGIQIKLGGEQEAEDRYGWNGYYADIPGVGETEHAYKSRGDCAVAALTVLRDRINDVL